MLESIHNDKLRTLDLGSNQLITPKGWQNLSCLLKTSCPSLEKLNISYCNIDDDGLDALVDALYESNVERLDLTSNDSISASGWRQSIATLLQSPNSAIRVLHLSSNSAISDKEALVYAKLLARNENLRILSLWGTSITKDGSDYLFNGICDTSSINNTFLSNHRIEDLSVDYGYLELERIVKLNDGSSCKCYFGKNDDVSYYSDDESSGPAVSDKAAVAIIKILNHHEKIDFSPFFVWEMKCLPMAVNWFQRARSVQVETDENDHYMWFPSHWDGEDEYGAFADADDYIIPDHTEGEWGLSPREEYLSWVDKRKMDAIYQFVRGNAPSFESISVAAMRKKRDHSEISN